MNKLEKFINRNYREKNDLNIYSEDIVSAQLFTFDLLKQLTIFVSNIRVLIISKDETSNELFEYNYHKNIFNINLNNFYNSKKEEFQYEKFIELIEVLNIKILCWNVVNLDYNVTQGLKDYTPGYIEHNLRIQPKSLNIYELNQDAIYISKINKKKMRFIFWDIETKQLIKKAYSLNESLIYDFNPMPF